MPSVLSQVEQDFHDAQFGRGTRLLTHEEAIQLLEHCERLGWAFQTMESFECFDGLEQLRVDLSILGLQHDERMATSFDELTQIAKQCLLLAQDEPHPFLFQVWVDKAESILSKAAARRAKR